MTKRFDAGYDFSSAEGMQTGANLVKMVEEATPRIEAVNSAQMEIASAAISIKAGGVSATELATDSVTTIKIEDDAVTSAKILAGAVGSSELADDAVDTAAIQNLAVTSAKIAASGVAATNIAAGAVTAAKLGDDVIVSLGTGGAFGVAYEAADVDNWTQKYLFEVQQSIAALSVIYVHVSSVFAGGDDLAADATVKGTMYFNGVPVDAFCMTLSHKGMAYTGGMNVIVPANTLFNIVIAEHNDTLYQYTTTITWSHKPLTI